MMSSTLARLNGLAPRSLDFESLNSRCFGRVDLVRRVLEVFHSTVDSDIALLEQAITAREWREAAKVAHRVKGSSLSVSASQLAEFSQQLERCAMNVAGGQTPQEADDLFVLESLLAELRVEYESVGEAIHTITRGTNCGQ
jgi:HPt (histidine-containing phosphotransfer) domain-containing protein